MSVEGQGIETTGVTGVKGVETTGEAIVFSFLRSFEYHNIGRIEPTSDLYFS
jgi:hypothetical protein